MVDVNVVENQGRKCSKFCSPWRSVFNDRCCISEYIRFFKSRVVSQSLAAKFSWKPTISVGPRNESGFSGQVILMFAVRVYASVHLVISFVTDTNINGV